LCQSTNTLNALRFPPIKVSFGGENSAWPENRHDRERVAEHIGLTIDEAAYIAIRKLSPELQ
jgi:hypothetical protein